MSAPLKILIVEDQFITAQNLETQLLELGYSITDTVANSNDAILAFRRKLPDLVLMDIDLKGSPKDGIEIAHEFNQIDNVPIIYLTSRPDKATYERAKVTRPANYLLKPWRQNQLAFAIDNALDNFVNGTDVILGNSTNSMNETSHQFLLYRDFFFVKTKGSARLKVLVDDMLCVEGARESVTIFTAKEKYMHSSNLQSFSEQVNHPKLLRVHRSHIVNVTKIEAIQDHHLVVGKKNIPVGPSYRAAVYKILNRLKAD